MAGSGKPCTERRTLAPAGKARQANPDPGPGGHRSGPIRQRSGAAGIPTGGPARCPGRMGRCVLGIRPGATVPGSGQCSGISYRGTGGRGREVVSRMLPTKTGYKKTAWDAEQEETPRITPAARPQATPMPAGLVFSHRRRNRQINAPTTR